MGMQILHSKEQPTVKTFRNHVSTVLAKLGFQTKSEAIFRAREAVLGRHRPDWDVCS
jgi:hypothetical protein